MSFLLFKAGTQWAPMIGRSSTRRLSAANLPTLPRPSGQSRLPAGSRPTWSSWRRNRSTRTASFQDFPASGWEVNTISSSSSNNNSTAAASVTGEVRVGFWPTHLHLDSPSAAASLASGATLCSTPIRTCPGWATATMDPDTNWRASSGVWSDHKSWAIRFNSRDEQQQQQLQQQEWEEENENPDVNFFKEPNKNKMKNRILKSGDITFVFCCQKLWINQYRISFDSKEAVSRSDGWSLLVLFLIRSLAGPNAWLPTRGRIMSILHASLDSVLGDDRYFELN